jgi:AcrR family transcriptional regulator
VAREAEVSEQTIYDYFQTTDQLVTDHAGQRLPDHHHRGRTPHPRGQSQDQIADELRPAIEAVPGGLDAWLTSATDQHNRNRAT